MYLQYSSWHMRHNSIFLQFFLLCVKVKFLFTKASSFSKGFKQGRFEEGRWNYFEFYKSYLLPFNSNSTTKKFIFFPGAEEKNSWTALTIWLLISLAKFWENDRGWDTNSTHGLQCWHLSLIALEDMSKMIHFLQYCGECVQIDPLFASFWKMFPSLSFFGFFWKMCPNLSFFCNILENA